MFELIDSLVNEPKFIKTAVVGTLWFIMFGLMTAGGVGFGWRLGDRWGILYLFIGIGSGLAVFYLILYILFFISFI